MSLFYIIASGCLSLLLPSSPSVLRGPLPTVTLTKHFFDTHLALSLYNTVDTCSPPPPPKKRHKIQSLRVKQHANWTPLLRGSCWQYFITASGRITLSSAEPHRSSVTRLRDTRDACRSLPVSVRVQLHLTGCTWSSPVYRRVVH